MMVHLWKDGGILCNPQEALTQSTSDPTKVTCPVCLYGKEAVKALEQAEAYKPELLDYNKSLRIIADKGNVPDH